MTKEEITDQWLQSLWVERDWAVGAALMSDDFEILGMQSMAQGKQSFLSFLKRFLHSFETVSAELTRTLESGHSFAAQFRFQGMHSERKREVDFVSALFIEFEGDSIGHVHVHFDFETMMIQLGLASYHRHDEVFEAKD